MNIATKRVFVMVLLLCLCLFDYFLGLIFF